jgi:hypothetical protein
MKILARRVISWRGMKRRGKRRGLAELDRVRMSRRV